MNHNRIIIRKSLLLLLSILFGCTSYMINNKLEKAIDERDYESLEALLYDLWSEDPKGYAQQIDHIENVLFDYYYSQGRSSGANGILEEAVSLYKKALSFKPERELSLNLERLVQAKDELDDLIRYLKSADTTKFLFQTEQLRRDKENNPATNRNKYLTRRLGRPFMAYVLRLDQILSSQHTSEPELYLALSNLLDETEIGEADVVKMYRRRIESFINKYRLRIKNPQFLNSRENRIELLRMAVQETPGNRVIETRVPRKDGLEILTGPGNFYPEDEISPLNLSDTVYVVRKQGNWIQFRLNRSSPFWTGWTERYSTRELEDAQINRFNWHTTRANTLAKEFIVGLLQDFYSQSSNGRLNNIEEIYEFFVANYVIGIDNTVLKNSTIEYVSDRTYRFAFRYVGNHSALQGLKELLGTGDDFVGNWFNNPKKTVIVSFTFDTLVVNIDAEKYKKRVYSKYLVGTRSKPNPDYNYWTEQVAYWNAEYARAIGVPSYNDGTLRGTLLAWARLSRIEEAQEGLENARRKLDQTPTIVEVNDYASYSFMEIGHNIYGELQLTMMIETEKSISLPIKVLIHREFQSRVGVMDNDSRSYRESRALIPTNIILENILLRNMVEKIENRLSQIPRFDDLNDLELLDLSRTRLMLDTKYRFMADEFIAYVDRLVPWIGRVPETKRSISHVYPMIRVSRTTHSFKNLKEVINYALNSSCQVVSYSDDFSQASGTGYFISENGFCVTNNHIIEEKENILLLRNEDSQVLAKNADVVFTDRTKDLALLKVRTPFERSGVIQLDPSELIEMGDEVLYVGFPGSPITFETKPFASRGIIGQVVKDENSIPALVLFDLTANPGASGSAVVNQRTGFLVGTLTWGFGRSISADDMIDLLGGASIRIKESQNVGTSVQFLIEFLKDSGYWVY